MPNVYRHRHRVSYAECTVGNHVYYSRYLDLLEIARGEFFRHLGVSFLTLQERQVIFPVVELQVRYLRPARYDDELEIALWLSDLGRVRLTFVSSIRRSGDELVQATTRHVCTNLQDKPQRLPEELVARLQPFLADDLPDAQGGLHANPG